MKTHLIRLLPAFCAIALCGCDSKKAIREKVAAPEKSPSAPAPAPTPVTPAAPDSPAPAATPRPGSMEEWLVQKKQIESAASFADLAAFMKDNTAKVSWNEDSSAVLKAKVREMATKENTTCAAILSRLYDAAAENKGIEGREWAAFALTLSFLRDPADQAAILSGLPAGLFRERATILCACTNMRDGQHAAVLETHKLMPPGSDRQYVMRSYTQGMISQHQTDAALDLVKSLEDPQELRNALEAVSEALFSGLADGEVGDADVQKFISLIDQHAEILGAREVSSTKRSLDAAKAHSENKKQ